MVQKSRETKSQKSEADAEVDQETLSAAQQAGKAALEGIDNEGLDRLLEDIDEVLEENAEEFVQGYIQKGGQ